MKTKVLRMKMGKSIATLAAVCSMLVSTPVSAAVDSTVNVNAPAEEACGVSASAESEWTVTIPKNITLDVNGEAGSADYEVSVTGKIDSTHSITVEPDSAFNMTQGDVNAPATVTQAVTAFAGKDLTLETPLKAAGTVNATGIRAGNYSGSFNFYISEKKTESVDEPDDAYAVAPEGAIENWDYTLDDTNNTILLRHYNGSETDVTVYASYPVNGKNYRTQIADTPTNITLGLFSDCRNIESVVFSKNIDTSNLTRINSMFSNCSSLKSVDLSGFDTSNVVKMSNMFSGCESLISLDLSNFNTSNLKNMPYMFSYCSSLTSVDLSSFDTSNVTSMHNLFERCSSLTSLDLSNFDTGSVTTTDNMFEGCRALKTIYATEGKWDLSNVSSDNMRNMFLGCGTDSVTYK